MSKYDWPCVHLHMKHLQKAATFSFHSSAQQVIIQTRLLILFKERIQRYHCKIHTHYSLYTCT